MRTYESSGKLMKAAVSAATNEMIVDLTEEVEVIGDESVVEVAAQQATDSVIPIEILQALSPAKSAKSDEIDFNGLEEYMDDSAEDWLELPEDQLEMLL